MRVTQEQIKSIVPGGLPGINLYAVRQLSIKHLRTVERGWRQGLCTWCLQPINGNRLTWCSEICTQKLKNLQVSRTDVWHRDKGVCSQCDLDTEAVGRELIRLGEHTVVQDQHGPLVMGHYSTTRRDSASIARETLQEASRWIKKEISEADVRSILVADWATARGVAWMLDRYSKHLWEADHIVPVAQGGGLLGLENMATLCLPCHWGKSKKRTRVRSRSSAAC